MLPGPTTPLNTGPTLPTDLQRTLVNSGGPLESPWLWGSLATVTVLAGVGWLWWAFRAPPGGRRRRLRLVGAAVTVPILALVSGGAWLNSQVGYFPTPASLSEFVLGGSEVSLPATNAGPAADQLGSPNPAGSRLVMETLEDAALGIRPGRTYVYLPAGYDSAAEATRRYPVVFLLHGFPGRAADWFEAGRAQYILDLLIGRQIVPPMIVVSPDASGGRGLYDSECLDAVPPEPKVESFVTHTVVSWLDQQFRTIPDRSARAIGGMSSGGYCALNVGLRQQDTFSVILGMQPYGDPGATGYAHLGRSLALRQANTPSRYIATMRFRHQMSIMLDAGALDPAGVTRARTLADILVTRGQDVAFRSEPSQRHSWLAARAGLPYMLDFAGQRLRTTAGGPPPTAGGPSAGAGQPGQAPGAAAAQWRTEPHRRRRRTLPGTPPSR
ncbi:MAG: esterase [Actinobacteria bacterium]|nr:esterase [Actinomycetota bacterium]MBI3687615.1 esterase [Actinomycetota bacterium]